MATPSISPVLDDQDQNQTSQASSTIPSETQTLSQSEEDKVKNVVRLSEHEFLLSDLWKYEGLKWETWLKENYDDLVDDNPLNVRYTYQDSIDKLDKKFRGTATHGLARSSTSFTFENMKKIISKMPPEQLVKTDKDEDLPVHSAIQSGIRVDQNKIGLFVKGDSQQISYILRAKNGKGKTPIELAFEMQHRAAVKLLFNLCVQHNVLSNLTGINFNLGDRSNTLLHIACREGMWSWFLDIVIGACNHDILPAIQVLDEEDHTPFHYLMNCIPDDSNELDTFRAVLDLLKQNEVDINKIYTDKNRRTMLHKAQRSNSTHAVSLLVEYNHKDVPDKQGTKPSQRVHHIEFEDMDKRVTSLVLSETSDVSSSSAPSYSSTSPFHSGTQVSEGQPLVRSSDETI
ncbi:uncharacterized protein LOC135351705 isoform X2 [Halichondria panicea]|uniref:uncharacterized protein LOC135351705 isoform X2 n=1 Tax=Halichondria panicea TaxID=6063 RepID=UPI00312B45BC